jgi:hypothetical protein
MKSKKVRGDRLVLALISAFRTLLVELSKKGIIDQDELVELSKKGIIDQDEFVALLQQTAIAHRESGDPNDLADAIHALSVHLEGSIP